MRFIWLGLFLIFPLFSFSQESEKALIFAPDIHFRTFWMSTTYPDDFKDDYALGASLNLGGKLTYRENFKFHIGYRTFANIWSSDISSPDPLTGQGNRYETGLFDLLDTEDKFFGKLETFSIEYSNSKWGAKAGRMGINSDWINAQDGRLSPTAVEGLNAWFLPTEKWKITVWGIGRMGVRGSSSWFDIGETVSIYPVGRSVDGKSSKYFGNTESDWIGIWEINHKLKGGELNFSQTLVQNISSTYWSRWERNWLVDGKKDKTLLGLQAGFQHGIGKGGNSDLSLGYKDPKDKNWAISGRIGYSSPKWITHLNYTKVGGSGRWLSPREWGKDAWYTFVPRERNEGFEDVDAVVSYAEYRFSKNQFQVYAHLGYHWLSDIGDAAANKYAFPSYRQINLGLKYKPEFVKNLDFHLLIMNKEALGDPVLTPNQRYNKVEMIHINAIANWRLN